MPATAKRPALKAPTLADRAMLVDLHMSFWEARKTDKTATRALTDTYGSADKQARVHKTLLARERLADLANNRQKLRTEFYRLTLPWLDGGSRALPGDLYFEFERVMGTLVAEHNKLVPEFVANYDSFVETDKALLGSLWNRDDYPPSWRIADKFRVRIVKLPIPVAGDFRSATLDQTELERIAADYAAFETQALARTVSDIGQRIEAELIGTDTVPGLIRKLERYDGSKAGRFNDSVIGNVRALVALLPALNIAGDPSVSQTIDRIKSDICTVDPDSLRGKDSDIQRADVIASARSILSDMAGFI